MTTDTVAAALGKVFKAYDVRHVYPQPLDEQIVWRIGVATGRFLLDKAASSSTPVNKSVAVSQDMRPSSPSLAAALIEGLLASGIDVIDLGMCDTSFQYFAINHLKSAGGVQVTASHNPIQYNGLKISGPQARPVGAATGLKDIQTLAATLGPRGSLPPIGKLTKQDLWAEYRKHVLSFYTPNPARAKPIKIFCDASNGMAGKMVPLVFDNVPGIEITRLNFEIGQGFAHEPNPLVAENMHPTQQGTKKIGADIGVCFDGDADRCILTDELGEIIACDHLTAFLSGYFLKQAPGAAIAYDLRSSKSVEETVLSHGGKPMRSRVGHVFMKQVMRDANGIFGGELSGHFYFKGNHFADSGAILFAVALSVLAFSDKPLSQLIAPFKKYPQSGERNFHVEDKAGVLAAMKKQFGPLGTVDELDGVTIDAWPTQGFWFNVRASNTEPLLRLNAEAKDAAKLATLLAQLKPLLGEEAVGH
jgi:phosphomannomutase